MVLQEIITDILPDSLEFNDWITIRIKGDLLLYFAKYESSDKNVLNISGFFMELFTQSGRTLQPVHPQTDIKTIMKVHFLAISSISKVDVRFHSQLDDQLVKVSAAQSGITTTNKMPDKPIIQK